MTVTPTGTTTIHIAGGAMCIDNASDTSSTALSRIFRLIKPINQVRVTTPDPTILDDPQTRDRRYDKTNTNSTIRYVNAQIT
jgi:hypothetical protein